MKDFLKNRWVKWTMGLVILLLCGVIMVIALGCLLLKSMAISIDDPSGDGFADGLTIPDNIQVAEPLAEPSAAPGDEADAFQQALLAALDTPGGNNPTIAADVTALTTLYADAPDVLMRYLATSPAWRVFEEHGEIFATRRWKIGSMWRYDLHGYYTRHDIDHWSEVEIPNFQSRFTIGFSGQPWARISRDTTRMRPGQTARLKLSEGNAMHESHCVIMAGDLVVEIFEQSEAKERRLTKAALAYLKAELAPLATDPTWETLRANLPPESIRQGEIVFELWTSFQPGLYDAELWLNPGEPGMIYLKAFEVTREIPLSVERLKERSNEWVGWSDAPAELFLSNTHFTIYEGDWGKPYAARFEVWFTPDAGGPDRKLMEKVFKIEGWQR